MPELLTALEFAWLPVQWSGRKITYTYREKKKAKASWGMISATLWLHTPSRGAAHGWVGVLAVSPCSPVPGVSHQPDFPKFCSNSLGIHDMTEGLVVEQLT